MPNEEAKLAVMEQISMYMTALPCPPLPVVVHMTTPGVANARRIPTTSHNILAGLLFAAMERGNQGLNEQRRTKQLRITDELITTLEGIGERLRDGGDGATEDAYTACQRFTVEYIHAFDDPGTPAPGIELKGMEEVPRNSNVHTSACSWHAAQDIQHVERKEDRRDAAHFAKMDYPALIREHLLRVTSRE